MYNERQNILQIIRQFLGDGGSEMEEFRCKRKRKGGVDTPLVGMVHSVCVCLYVRSLNYGTCGDLTGIERVIIVPPYGYKITPSTSPLPTPHLFPLLLNPSTKCAHLQTIGGRWALKSRG